MPASGYPCRSSDVSGGPRRLFTDASCATLKPNLKITKATCLLALAQRGEVSQRSCVICARAGLLLLQPAAVEDFRRCGAAVLPHARAPWGLTHCGSLCAALYGGGPVIHRNAMDVYGEAFVERADSPMDEDAPTKEEADRDADMAPAK
jgi:hypothetical protein